MMNKKNKTHKAFETVRNLSPPRSAPAMIPQRVKSKKHILTSSDSAISKQKGAPNILTYAESTSLMSYGIHGDKFY